MTEPFVSIIVCTYNRRDLLNQCIESLFNQGYSKVNYEIILVDSSIIGIDDLLNYFYDYAPCGFRYIRQANIGLSAARNIGINDAKGDIIAFIDDDAKADKDWLSNIVRAYDSPDIACVGGKVKPLTQKKFPAWLPNEFLYLLTILDFGNSKRQMNYPNYPCGTNISFRKDVFRNMLFSEKLGRKENLLLSNDETAICYALEKSRRKIVYDPDAVVYHFVDDLRLSKMFLRKRLYWQGLSDAILEKEIDNRIFSIKKTVRFLFRTPINILFICLNIFNKKRRFFFEGNIIKDIGYIVGAFYNITFLLYEISLHNN